MTIHNFKSGIASMDVEINGINEKHRWTAEIWQKMVEKQLLS